MANLLLVFFCIVAGVVFKRWRILPSNTPQVLNGILFTIALPALILGQLSQMKLTVSAIYPVASIWILFFGSVLIFGWGGKSFGLSRKSIGALILTAGLGNTGFLGYPLVQALYGQQLLRTAMLADQLGSFLILSTLGVAVAAYYSDRSSDLGSCVKRVFSFPPIYALILALMVRGYPLPSAFFEFLNPLGALLVPLALISTGFQLNFGTRLMKQKWKPFVAGLSYKLVLGPLFLIILFVGLGRVRGESIQVAFLEAAMAPMITAGVVAAEYELDIELVNLMLGVGIPLSLITVPVLAHWMSWI